MALFSLFWGDDDTMLILYTVFSKLTWVFYNTKKELFIMKKRCFAVLVLLLSLAMCVMTGCGDATIVCL